ncbi:MAG: hypothetical protein MZV63_60165 [Marinilabiliales bacterium]|nr:hypothetical protein [Marinilabiliales bacterium]
MTIAFTALSFPVPPPASAGPGDRVDVPAAPVRALEQQVDLLRCSRWVIYLASGSTPAGTSPGCRRAASPCSCR